MNAGLWHIISTTDLMTKAVLLVLLAMSIGCWAYAFYKRMIIIMQLKQLKQAATLLQNTKSMDDFMGRIAVLKDTFAGELISLFLADFNRVLKLSENNPTSYDAACASLDAAISQRIDETLAQEELLIPLLSTNAQAAPLIGLFGTVWGLIHAFMGIAEARSADISAVAPGIAEALITTLGGLVVAIPALVLYNYIQNYAKQLESAVYDVAQTCLWTMRGVLVNRTGQVNGAFVRNTTQSTQGQL